MVVGAVYLYNFRKAYLVNEFFVQSVHIALQLLACYLSSRNEMKCGTQMVRARKKPSRPSVIPLVHHLPRVRPALRVYQFVVLISEDIMVSMCALLKPAGALAPTIG
jgi:hypothetical protein